MNRHHRIYSEEEDQEVRCCDKSACPYVTPQTSIPFYDYCSGHSYSNGYYSSYITPPCPLHHQQDNFYRGMNVSANANAYKFEYPGHGNAYYNNCFDHYYEVNNHPTHMDAGRRVWDYTPFISEDEQLAAANPDMPTGENRETAPPLQYVTLQESSPVHDNSQVIWQDNIDPDNTTYEELLDLGEAIGTECCGLSEELIGALPTSRYKPGGIYSKNESKERCVICQMRFKIGERQTKLPCKHCYHWECISKWLTINKVCPICNVEVLGEKSKQ